MFPLKHSFKGTHHNGSLWGQRQGWLEQTPNQLRESVNDNVADENPAKIETDHLAKEEDKDREPWKDQEDEKVDCNAKEERNEWVGHNEGKVEPLFAWRQPTKQTR